MLVYVLSVMYLDLLSSLNRRTNDNPILQKYEEGICGFGLGNSDLVRNECRSLSCSFGKATDFLLARLAYFELFRSSLCKISHLDTIQL